MDNRTEMIKALESHYQSMMDRYAIDINNLLNKSDSDSLDLLIDNVQKYSHVLNQFNFVQKLKERIINSIKEDDNES